MERAKAGKRTGRRGVLMAALVALGLGIAMAVSADDAAACRRTSMDGNSRRCTASENFFQCFKDSEDAYWQCRRRHPGFWGLVKCSFANNIDHSGCILGTGIYGITKPFQGR